MIKYLGSKRTLIPSILDAVGSLPGVRTVLDLFSGTSRVGHALKAHGYRVIANDHNAYAHALAMCYVQADAKVHGVQAASLIGELDAVSGAAGEREADPFTRTYAVESRFFHPRNGARIFAIREAIEALDAGPEMRAILLTSLMEAADRVDSTTGVQMAYLKAWAPRALRGLELRLPRLLPGRGLAANLDAVEAARRYAPEADAVYIDPPYNQHSYLGNYHIWETLVRWDFPEVYGVARKREDVRTRRSAFNSRRGCLPAMASLLGAIPAEKPLIVSFSDEGFIGRAEMESLLGRRGEVRIIEHDYKRYVGAQIGIYNPAGRKVGRVSHLRNTERLFIVTP